MFYRHFARMVWYLLIGGMKPPDAFRFMLKASRDMTYTVWLHEIDAELTPFVDSIQQLYGNCSIFLFTGTSGG
jgi:uncharacterized protein YecE (DUF72 family)